MSLIADAQAPGTNVEAGFTLFEVLIALAVFALMVAVMMPLVSVSIRRSLQEPDRLAVIAAGYDLLQGLQQREAIRAGTSSGVLGTVHWRMEATEIETPVSLEVMPRWRPYRLVVDLTGPNNARTRIETIRLGRQGP